MIVPMPVKDAWRMWANISQESIDRYRCGYFKGHIVHIMPLSLWLVNALLGLNRISIYASIRKSYLYSVANPHPLAWIWALKKEQSYLPRILSPSSLNWHNVIVISPSIRHCDASQCRCTRVLSQSHIAMHPCTVWQQGSDGCRIECKDFWKVHTKQSNERPSNENRITNLLMTEEIG